MGFWSKLFKREAFEDKRAPAAVCRMSLCGSDCLLAEFDLKFDREDTSAEYLSAYAIFEEGISATIESWITNSSRKESGNIRFYEYSDTIEKGAMLEIAFQDAVCTKFRRNIVGGKLLTTVTMTIPRITIAGEEL